LIGAEEFLLLISSTLFLCYISGLIYTKTKIPDILWLLGFGIILGPVLGVIERESFEAISPLMGVIALCVITFNSGISLDVKTFQKTLYKSFVLTIVTFFSIVFIVGFAVSFLMPETFNILEGMLLGTIIGGISTVAVTSLLNGLQQLFQNLETTRALLTLESTLCDPIRVVAAITLIRMMNSPTISIRDSAKEIVFTFVVASIVGVLLSLLWAEVLDIMRGLPLNYMMTMAVLFPTYLLGERVGQGGGTMAAFVFGLVLANYKNVTRWLGFSRTLKPDTERIMELNEEMTFLLKSYYFVYIGLIVSISRKYMFLGIGLTLLLILVRFIIGTAVGDLMRFTNEEKVISRLVFTLGTSTLVMSQLPRILDPKMLVIRNPTIYTDLCFPVVLGTVAFAALFSPIIARKQLKP
jgi:cell volume regulation protein A